MSVLGGRRGQIQLGELIRALVDLDCAESTPVRAIAACLGFRLSDANSPSTTTVGDRSQPSQQSCDDKPQSAPARGPGFQMPPSSPAPAPLPAEVLTAQLVSLETLAATDSSAAPAWLAGGYQRVDPERSSPPRQTLFPARAVRGVVIAALASWRPGDEIDVDELVRCVVRGRIPPRLPRLPSTTPNSGCQLLLDYSESMVPWWEDLRELARQVSGVLGAERTAIYDFAASPATASRWRADRESLEAWQAEPGRPILVATDFGIRGEPLRDLKGTGWQGFVDACAARDCPLLVLVPWSRVFWPKHLGLHPQLVHWHPATSAAMLRRQRGLAHRTAR